MNLFEKHGRFPGDFRHELRRVILKELADVVGMDIYLED